MNDMHKTTDPKNWEYTTRVNIKNKQSLVCDSQTTESKIENILKKIRGIK